MGESLLRFRTFNEALPLLKSVRAKKLREVYEIISNILPTIVNFIKCKIELPNPARGILSFVCANWFLSSQGLNIDYQSDKEEGQVPHQRLLRETTGTDGCCIETLQEHHK